MYSLYGVEIHASILTFSLSTSYFHRHEGEVTMSGPNDTGYKLLFAHPEMVRDLLVGYVPGAWVAEADFSTLERVNASYVSESEKQRHDDMVWRQKATQVQLVDWTDSASARTPWTTSLPNKQGGNESGGVLESFASADHARNPMK